MKFKLALRSLMKNPFVTFVAIISLALGIGANAAMGAGQFAASLLFELKGYDPIVLTISSFAI